MWVMSVALGHGRASLHVRCSPFATEVVRRRSMSKWAPKTCRQQVRQTAGFYDQVHVRFRSRIERQAMRYGRNSQILANN